MFTCIQVFMEASVLALRVHKIGIVFSLELLLITPKISSMKTKATTTMIITTTTAMTIKIQDRVTKETLETLSCICTHAHAA